jgi:magnesium-transporting ATPase (P-type)
MHNLLAFSHPILMFGLLGLYVYTAYLGMRSRRIQKPDGEPKNRGKSGLSHHKIASAWLALMVFGAILGITVTYINNGKLFFSPHMWVGLSVILLISIGSALVPFMQQKDSQYARKAHATINMLVLLLFAFEALSGVAIVQQILSFKS